MQKYIELHKIPEYDSLYQDIYIKDLVTIRYNVIVYNLLHRLIENSTIWSQQYNIQNIYMKCTLINIKDRNNKFVVINNKKLHYPYVDSEYDEGNNLKEHFNFLNYKKFIGDKIKMITTCNIEYNNKFDFQFDGDTGDISAGEDVKIKNFNDSNRPYDKDIIGRKVKWINANGDVEEHEITHIESNKKHIKFADDIKNTNDNTLVKSIEDKVFTSSSIAEHRFIIKG